MTVLAAEPRATASPARVDAVRRDRWAAWTFDTVIDDGAVVPPAPLILPTTMIPHPLPAKDVRPAAAAHRIPAAGNS